MTAAQLRLATVADATAIARVHVMSSEDAYAPLAAAWIPLDVAERTRSWEEWLTVGQRDPHRVDLVAEVDGEIVGFVTVGTSRQRAVESRVEVYVIHVLPERRGRGIGARLWAEACGLGRGRDMLSMCVRTFAELRCCRFYEARGGVVVAREPTTFEGGRVTEVVYRWADGQPHDALEKCR